MTTGRTPTFRASVTCSSHVPDADVLAACVCVAEGLSFEVSRESSRLLVLRPSSPAVGMSFWRRADPEMRVELAERDSEAGNVTVWVASQDAEGRSSFCAALEERLRRLEPVALQSLEDFLLSAAPDRSAAAKRDVAELLRRKSVSDWYAQPEHGGAGRGQRPAGASSFHVMSDSEEEEVETRESTPGGASSKRYSVGDWYLDGKPRPSTATPETRNFRLSMDDGVEVEELEPGGADSASMPAEPAAR
eukprot:CAMPEP_0204579952 /NCGR_PEP_ID=MMETSP0661-20131031/43790_1 /ASSEMBLY_ACC=CAM_ASM_000606 /TAXON_ID=109239 /ORGANISM="Alexandrium margalefi, Strain AMGDE01CS-322" /LENGTH=247 /DNA_ID=CAMNT_0051589009 /DNA_START=21 /DNA_END=764 /DNA_ORIENTATION=+